MNLRLATISIEYLQDEPIYGGFFHREKRWSLKSGTM